MSADPADRSIRSMLFAPASEPRKLTRLLTTEADAIVFDLEDAVAEASKDAARAALAEALGRPRRARLAMVRINGLETATADSDLEAAVHPSLDAVIVPKVEDARELERVGSLLDTIEAQRSIPRGHTRVVALVETARGVLQADSIAAGADSRLLTLALGSEDLATDARLEPSADGLELAFARSRVVFAAAAARLAPPLDGPYLAFRDLEGLRTDSLLSRRSGFGGRVLIHPDQVAVAHEVYGAQDAAELRRAEKIVQTFEEAERAGHAAVDVDGSFVDYPIYERARLQLAEHESGLRDGAR